MPLLRYPLRALARRNLVPYRLLNGALGDEVITLQAPFSGEPFRYALDETDQIGAILYWYGWQRWERLVVPHFLRLLDQTKVFLDIGSHTGVYSLLACAHRKDIQVRAFEPNPRIFKKLLRNVEINGFGDRCILSPAALSDSCGTATFYLPEDPTMGTLEPEIYSSLIEGQITVERSTADTMIPADVRVDLIKIDVEGHEHQVMLGMTRILKENRPVLIFECLPDGPTELISSALKDSGYQVCLIGEHGLEPASAVVPPSVELSNFLAYHPSRPISGL